MSFPALRVAKTLSELVDWNITNLQLQKILYITHMFYIGRELGPKLIREEFEAWDYGPVIPVVYRELKSFGSSNILNIFTTNRLKEDEIDYTFLREITNDLKEYTGGELVSITHHPEGAWHKCYKENVKGIVIPTEEIKNEYDELYKE
ncbi:MAG: DUF4065 domain-containing protein [Alphaproteobacteria bacterium]|nr:DUF4065 domain-containing protein [Alphaproteobacteria bacterium]